MTTDLDQKRHADLAKAAALERLTWIVRNKSGAFADIASACIILFDELEHLRTPPTAADKAEAGGVDGPDAEQLRKIQTLAFEVELERQKAVGEREDKHAAVAVSLRAIYDEGYEAGQQSRLDERELARLGTLCAAWFRLFWPRVVLVLEGDEEANQPGSMGDMLRQAIADGKMLFEQAAKTEAGGVDGPSDEELKRIGDQAHDAALRADDAILTAGGVVPDKVWRREERRALYDSGRRSVVGEKEREVVALVKAKCLHLGLMPDGKWMAIWRDRETLDGWEHWHAEGTLAEVMAEILHIEKNVALDSAAKSDALGEGRKA